MSHLCYLTQIGLQTTVFVSQTMPVVSSCVTWGRTLISQIHEIKAETTDEVFLTLFLWERGAPIGKDRGLFHLLQHKNKVYNTLKEA